MGSMVIMVAAALTVIGVTALALATFFAPSALPLCCITEFKSFISSYCSVVYWDFIRLYSMASNQEFHWYTATNKATVAYTGLHSGEIIFTNMVK